MSNDREYLSVKDIQAMFKISRASAYNLMTTKGVPSIRIGRKFVVEKNDFYKFLDDYKGGTIYLKE